MLTSTSIGTGGLGRFGNQLFTIAGVIGIADKNGQPFGFPEWKNFDNALFGDEITDFKDVFVNPLPDLRGIDPRNFIEYGYFWGYRDVMLQQGNWSINAHLQSPKFFEHSIDKVRHYFTMKDEPEQNDYVAIHYRAGDYIDNPEAYHPRCSVEYYKEAMKEFPGATFLLFSDDVHSFVSMIGWTQNMIIGSRPNGDYIEDFKLMKKCKHFIIANSSFSAMAAILADHPEKKVIAPKRWFGTQANGLSSEDIYDKNWILI